MPPKKRKPAPASPPRGPALELRGGANAAGGGGGGGGRRSQHQHQPQHQQQRATGFQNAHHRPIRTHGAPPSQSQAQSQASRGGGESSTAAGGAGKRARTTTAAGAGNRAASGGGGGASAAASSASSASLASRAAYGHGHGRGGAGGGTGGGGRLSHTSYQLGSPAVAALRLEPLPDPVVRGLHAALPFQARKGFAARRLTQAAALLGATTDGLLQYLPQPAPPYSLPTAPGPAPACLLRRRPARRRDRGDEGPQALQRDWLLVPADLRTRWLLRRAAAAASSDDEEKEEDSGEQQGIFGQEEAAAAAPPQLDLRRLLQAPGAPAPILLMPDPTLEEGVVAVGEPALAAWLGAEGAAVLAAEAGMQEAEEEEEEEEEENDKPTPSPLLSCPCSAAFPLSHAGFAPHVLDRSVLGFAAASSTPASLATPLEQAQAALWQALATAAYHEEEEEEEGASEDVAALERLRGGPVALRRIDWEEVDEEAAAGGKTKAGLLALGSTTALVGALVREAAGGKEGEEQGAAEEAEAEPDDGGQLQRLCMTAASPLLSAAAAFPLFDSSSGGDSGGGLAAWVLGSGAEKHRDAMEVDGSEAAAAAAAAGVTGAGLLAALAPDPGDDAVFPPAIPRYSSIPEHEAPGPAAAPLLLLLLAGGGGGGGTDDAEEEAAGRLAAWGLQLMGGAAIGELEVLPASALGPAPSFILGGRSSGSGRGQRGPSSLASLLLLGPDQEEQQQQQRRCFLALPPPPSSYPPMPLVKPSAGDALAALLPQLLALLGDASRLGGQRRPGGRPFAAVLSATAKASPLPAATAARPLHWRPGMPAPRRKPWEEAAAVGGGGGGMGPLPDFFRLSDLDDPVGHDLALMLSFSCDDPGLEVMGDWYEERRRLASPSHLASSPVAAAEEDAKRRKAGSSVQQQQQQQQQPQVLRVTVSGKATAKGESLAGVFAAAPVPARGKAEQLPPSQGKKQHQQLPQQQGDDDDFLFTQPSPASSSSAASSPLAASPPRTQARVLLQPGASGGGGGGGGAGGGALLTGGRAGGGSSSSSSKGSSPAGGQGGADALLDDFFQLRKPHPAPAGRRGRAGPARGTRPAAPTATVPRAPPAAAMGTTTSAAGEAGGASRPGQATAPAPGPAHAAATCLVAERLLDLGEDELIQGMAREFNVSLVDVSGGKGGKEMARGF